jgi:hypothetical protein
MIVEIVRQSIEKHKPVKIEHTADFCNPNFEEFNYTGMPCVLEFLQSKLDDCSEKNQNRKFPKCKCVKHYPPAKGRLPASPLVSIPILHYTVKLEYPKDARDGIGEYIIRTIKDKEGNLCSKKKIYKIPICHNCEGDFIS